MIVSNSMSSLVIARRLILIEQEMAAERSGKKGVRKTALEVMQEDEALMSGEMPGEADRAKAAQNAVQP